LNAKERKKLKTPENAKGQKWLNFVNGKG